MDEVNCLVGQMIVSFEFIRNIWMNAHTDKNTGRMLFARHVPSGTSFSDVRIIVNCCFRRTPTRRNTAWRYHVREKILKADSLLSVHSFKLKSGDYALCPDLWAIAVRTSTEKARLQRWCGSLKATYTERERAYTSTSHKQSNTQPIQRWRQWSRYPSQRKPMPSTQNQKLQLTNNGQKKETWKGKQQLRCSSFNRTRERAFRARRERQPWRAVHLANGLGYLRMWVCVRYAPTYTNSWLATLLHIFRMFILFRFECLPFVWELGLFRCLFCRCWGPLSTWRKRRHGKPRCCVCDKRIGKAHRYQTYIPLVHLF